MTKRWVAVLGGVIIMMIGGTLGPGQTLSAGSGAAWAAEVKFSGELRMRGEYNENMDFNQDASDLQSFVGQRSRVNLDIQADTVSGFVQIQDSRFWGEDSNLAAPNGFSDTGRELQATDLRQAYIQIKNLFGGPVTFKYGRQILAYGDERLVGGFEWSNFSRAYDGIKLSYGTTPLDVDLFTAKLNEASPAADANFSGIYATVKTLPGNNLQLYYLADIGDSGKNESTVGGRVQGKWNALDYTGELAVQAGDKSSTTARDANAYALMAGYTIADLLGGLRVGAEYDFATGNDSTTADDETFNNLYPTNHLLYGLNDNGNVWSDINAWAVTLKAKPVKGVWCKLEYWNLQRDTGVKADGTPKTGAALAEGTEINLQAGYAYSDNLDFLIQVMQFTPDSVSGDDSQQYAVLQSMFKF